MATIEQDMAHFTALRDVKLPRVFRTTFVLLLIGFLAVVAFLIYVQSIQMLEGLADIGRVPAGPSIWTPFVLLALGSGILFWRVWRRVAFEPAIGGAPRIRLPKRKRRRRVGGEAAEA